MLYRLCIILSLVSGYAAADPCSGTYAVIAGQDRFALKITQNSGSSFQAKLSSNNGSMRVTGTCNAYSSGRLGQISFERIKSGKSQTFSGEIQPTHRGVQAYGQYTNAQGELKPWRAYQIPDDMVIRLNSMADADNLRSNLVDLLWQGNLPSRLPNQVRSNVGSPFYGLRNLKSVDLLQIETAPGFQSNAYFFHPRSPRNRVVIFHQGHNDKIEKAGGSDFIQTFLDLGYDVLGFYMPLFGPNTGPQGFDSHDHGAIVNTYIQNGPYPISIFLEPVIVGINYIESLKKYPWIAMAGISGGGWTTTLTAAIDPRIRFSFPIAGSKPLSWKNDHDWGDPEQFEGSFLQIASFTELYTLGALGEGRRQVQIHNEFDSCCYAISKPPTFVDLVQTALAKLNGQNYAYSLFIDRGQKKHMITQRAIDEFILPVLSSQ